jgi:hypothetical protein
VRPVLELEQLVLLGLGLERLELEQLGLQGLQLELLGLQLELTGLLELLLAPVWGLLAALARLGLLVRPPSLGVLLSQPVQPSEVPVFLLRWESSAPSCQGKQR